MSTTRGLRVELSTDSVEGSLAIDALGADRIELCSAGALGGLTPGPGLLATVLRQCRRSEVHVLIRPRDGGFAYTASEVDAMVADVRFAREAGAAGIVIGAADDSGELDTEVLGTLAGTSGGLAVTVHRVIDGCTDPVSAVETLAGLGVQRVLSSGGATRAEDGAPVLRRMVEASEGRLDVMACGGIRPHNAREIAAATGVRDIHAAPRRAVSSPTRRQVDYGVHAPLDVDAARALVELRDHAVDD